MPPPPPCPPTRPAFTLIEVIIVVAIIAIASALALPMLQSSKTYQLRGAAQLLLADLEYAQTYSIAHGDDPCVLMLDPLDATRYWLAKASAPATPLTNPADHQPYLVIFGVSRAHALANVTLSTSTVGGDNKLGFRSLGQLDQATAAVFTLTAGASTLTLTLEPGSGTATVSSLP